MEKQANKLPVVAIVGRPNVGKSALFNRLTGQRRAIVTDEPGITRDRLYGQATWQGKAFTVVDTGGLLPDEKAQLVQDILRHGMPRDVTAAARGLEGRCPSSQPLSECPLPGIRVAV